MLPLSLYLSVYFKSTDRYNDNKDGGRANLGTVWAYRMRQAQTVPKPFRAKRCKVRDVKRCWAPLRGARLDAFASGSTLWGEAKRSRAEGGTPEKRH